MSATSPDSASLHAIAASHYVSIYRPRNIVLDHGKGARVWDRDGRDYVDFGAGIAVNSLGHAHPALIEALTTQAAKLWHTSNVFVSEPPLRLAEALVNSVEFARRVYLCNSGTEANEAAIKLARRWATDRGRDPSRRVILSFSGSFHGRTLAAVTATAQPKYHEGFEPLPGGFRYATFNDVDTAREAMAAGDVCAVLVEPVQGEGGVTPATDAFLHALRTLCDAHDALLIFDEIQCGMARTGTLFAFEGPGVVPDVVTLAKALGGGFPVGAMLVGDRAADTLQFGHHGTTFGGNPLASAVALAALQELNSPALRDNVHRQSRRLQEVLTVINDSHGLFVDIRGRGLMIGAQLVQAHAGQATAVLDACVEHGLLLLQAGPDVLRFVPPLNITDEELEEGLQRFSSAIATWKGGSR